MERRLEEKYQLLLPIKVRILDRLFYGELSAWCYSAHGFWDRAIANCSSLRVQPSTQVL